MQSEYSIVVSDGSKTPHNEQKDFSALRRNELHCSQSRCLQLKFMDNIIGPVYTGLAIQGEHGTLKVALIDAVTGDVVKSCPEASAKLELVILDKNFNFTDEEDWSCEDYNSQILGGRDGKSSLLRRDPYVYLEEGVGCVNDIFFKHARCWFRKLNCRLGARIVDQSNGTRIREAKTEPFFAMDRRGMIKKHKALFLTDEVWRLERIGKNGRLHNLLRRENILTVKNFLTEFYGNSERLQHILEANISGKKWEATVKHALTCKLDGTRYLYFSPSSEQKVGVVFNVVGKLMGLCLEGQFVPVEMSSASHKIHGCRLVVSAFQHWNDVKKYHDDNSLMHYISILRFAINPSETGKVDGSHVWNSHTSVINENLGTGFDTSSRGAVSHSDYTANANTSNDYSLDTKGDIDHINIQSLSSMVKFPTFPDYESEHLMDQIMDLVYAENSPPDIHDPGSHVKQNAVNNLQCIPAASSGKAKRWWKKVFHVLKWSFQKKKVFSSEDAQMAVKA